GPHPPIICSLTGTGHGAAAWMHDCSDDTSYFLRTSPGSFSMRTNMVGTTWVWVTLCFSISRRYSSGSKCSMITDVPPMRITPMSTRSGAEWYTGAGDRYGG